MIRVTTPGLRSRVALIVTIPFLVVVAMLVYAFDSDRDAQLAHARERVLGEARALASEQRTALGVLRQFLASTAVLPELHGHAAEGSCDRALAGRHPADASLAHLVIARPDGNVLCQSGHAPPVWTVRDLALFRRVLAVQDTLVGSYADVWGDGAPPMALAMPARRGGDVVAVLIAAISPRLLERTFAASGLPPDATVTMLDGSGVVVAHYPAAMPGRPAEPFPLPDRAALLRGDVTLDATGPDAVRRIHGYATLVDDAGPPLYLAVGLPRDAVVGPVERSFLLRLGITLGLLSLMFAYVAYRSEWLFVKPILRLTWMAGEIARGRLSVRSGLAGGTPEMRRLAAALDAMAEALEAERARVDGAHRALARLDARLQSLPAAAAYVDAGGCVVYANAACAAWMSRTPEDAVGAPLGELLAPELHAAALPHVEQARRGHAQHFQLDVAGRGGERRHAEVFLIPEAGSDGGFLLFVLDATEHRAEVEAMAQLAQVDALTGLPNRRTFLYALEGARRRATRHHSGMAVLFLDLDRFKEINDTLGHHVGDLVLRAFAKRIGEASRRSDVVGRLGGDEFAVLLEGVERREAVDVVVAAMRAALAAPCTVEGRGMTLSASIGAAFAPPGSDASGEALLAEADAAMYRDKRARAAAAGSRADGLDTREDVVR